MAVINDEFLSSLLHQAGDAFAVPEAGPDAVLARAQNADGGAPEGGAVQTSFALSGLEAEPGGGAGAPAPRSGGARSHVVAVRRLRATMAAHRVLSAAAAIVVLAAVGGSALLIGRSGGPARSPLTTAQSAAPRTQTTVVSPNLGANRPAAGATAPGAAPSTPSTHSAPSFGVAGGATASGSGTTGTATSGTATSGTATSGTATSGTATGSAKGAATLTAPLPSSDSVGQPARIQQTGSLTLQVAKGAVATAMTKLTFLATAYGGFVASSQTQSNPGQGGPTGSITLQVPVGSFSAVLKSAQSLGKTLQVQSKATDVTAQYVDLQAQISALQSSRQQYLTIMSRATTIGDVLAVQSQLDSLQQQIQQLQGQLQVLSSETSYSTLVVEVSQSAVIRHHRPPAPESGLARAWHDSVHGFVDGADGLVSAGGPALFVLLCAAAVFVIGRLLWRRFQRFRL